MHKNRKGTFRFKDEAGRKVLYIYGTIGDDWWSPEDANRAKDIAKELDEITPAPLDIRINSGGGDVFEGFAIASAIQRYEGDTCTYVDGLAASAASYIALMSDRVIMSKFAKLMIHKAGTFEWGNSDDLRKTADILDELDESIAGIIADRSNLTKDEAKDAMKEETWYSAESALEAGLCDEVIETDDRISACVSAKVAANFKNMPSDVGIVDEEDEDVEPFKIPESEKSHLENKIDDNEGAAVSAIVLGNRVYRRNQNAQL